MGQEAIKRALRFVKLSIELARSQGIAKMVQALHRQYVHKRLPPKTRFMPTAMEVEITTHCNLNCFMCRGSFAPLQKNEARHMHPEDFSLLMDQLPFLDIISFRGTGEPLMHPEVVEIADRAVRSGKRVRISTNGTLLTGPLADALLDVPVQEISFSIDACSPETYSRIRRGADLDAVLENLRSAGQKVLARKGTELTVMFIVMRSNFRELRGLLERIDGAGVSYLVPKFLNPGVNPDLQQEKLTGEDLSEFRGIIGALEGSEVRLVTDAVLMNGGGGKKPQCTNLWESPFVTVDGKLSLCPSAFYNHDLSFGNVLEGDFRKLWNSDGIQRHRCMIAEGNAPFCKGCPVMQLLES